MLKKITSPLKPLVFTPVFTVVLVGIFTLTITSCRKDEDAWSRRAWIGKAARLLRMGQGLTPADDIEKLEKLSREKVIEHFMKDPLFSNTVLDFNLYFLGIKNDPLIEEDGLFQDRAFYMPGAVASAVETYRDGNYLKLLDWKQPLYLNPTLPVIFPMAGKPTPAPGEETERTREAYIQMSINSMDRVVALAERGYRENLNEICATLLAQDGPFNALSFGGIQVNVFFAVRGTPNWFADVYLPCTLAAGFEPPSNDMALKRFRKIGELWPKVIELYRSTNPNTYKPETVSELRELKLPDFNLEGEIYQLNRAVYSFLLNSSTNYNRKRAAFIFKRYFCDDLTPIAIEQPEIHSRGGHASDPACMSCHYKLDPMAGFFKDAGYGGYPFGSKPKMLFDDMALMDREAYQSVWRAPEGSGREWNIGYVRSLQFPENNEWGSSIEDLFAIIKRAPEVKRCIVKRMTQYVWGENQIIDAGYLEYLTKEFEKTAEVNSARAFKVTMGRLILSKTFETNDPEPSQCYDYAPGESPNGRPPCRVARLLENNCVQCHGHASAFGGLNLSVWQAGPDGKMGFKHVTSNGTVVPAKTSFEKILSRLEHSDSELRMPLGKYMSQSDRVELVLWTREKLEESRQ